MAVGYLLLAICYCAVAVRSIYQDHVFIRFVFSFFSMLAVIWLGRLYAWLFSAGSHSQENLRELRIIEVSDHQSDVRNYTHRPSLFYSLMVRLALLAVIQTEGLFILFMSSRV